MPMSKDSRRTARWVGQASAHERQLRSEFVEAPEPAEQLAAKPEPWTAKQRQEMKASQRELETRFASMSGLERHAEKLVIRTQLSGCCETDFEFRRVWTERFLPHVPKPELVSSTRRTPKKPVAGVRRLRLDSSPVRPGATDWGARLARHDAKKQKAQDAARRRVG